jgi:hypothetical protein
VTTWITDVQERRRLGRRAQLLAAASVTYDVAEAVVAIAVGVVADSVALVGFGLDSIVEVSSGLIILWRFRHRLPESRERLALRMLAGSFFALAGHVSVESVRALVGAQQPDASPVGVGLAVASLIVMPLLSGAASYRSSAGLERGRRRRHPSPAVHLPVGRTSRRPGTKRNPGLVLGRSDRRTRDRRRGGARRNRGLARRRLLCAGLHQPARRGTDRKHAAAATAAAEPPSDGPPRSPTTRLCSRRASPLGTTPDPTARKAKATNG